MDPRHLLPGENPPSALTQGLANTLAGWTDARRYGLPTGPQSLTAVSSGFDPSIHGSHWQRFVNTFGLELQLLDEALDENLSAGFLEYPGAQRTGLDLTWKVVLPGYDTVVTSVQANDAPVYLNTVNVDGTAQLDPNRAAAITLQAAPRLFDFYYGLAQEATFTVGTPVSVLTLGSRVGINADGSAQIEWITINGTTTTAWTLGADKRSINFTSPLTTGSNVVVHYTTYDIYYLLPGDLQGDLPALFTRSSYFELFLTTSGTKPASTNPANVAANISVVTPKIDMIWSELDEIGLYLNKPRNVGESNQAYQMRLIDSVLYPQDATKTGLRNALATELGLVQHLTWGAGTAMATTLALGSQVYADSILVDRLPLPYYSVKTTSNQTGAIPFSVPSLAIGASTSFKLQLVASGGEVIPGAVPLQFSLGTPVNTQAIYDQIIPNRLTSSFSAPNNPWYRGTLQVWKNGVPLTAGTDFIEQSTTSFTLTQPALKGDLIQLGYMYDAAIAPPQLEASADLETDLAPLLRFNCSYTPDPTGVNALQFPGWAGLPANTDPATLPTNGTWTVTITVTNAGSAPSAGFTFTAQLPPQISFDGTYLTIDTLTGTHDLRYIDGATVWVNNLTDATLQTLLYDAQGRATPLLKTFAAEIAQTSPYEWGQVRWDRTIWHTLNERYDQFGFIPHLLDPPYQLQLQAQRIRFGGVLTSSSDNTSPVAIAGQATFGPGALQSDTTPFFIDFSRPGTALGVSGAVRYPDFVSGIGADDDLKLTIADPAAVTLANSNVPQDTVLYNSTVRPNFIVPAAQTGAWWAAVNPGTYFLNQEEHTFFSQPRYAETTRQQLTLPEADPFKACTAAVYDPQAGLQPLRRVFFSDANGNLTLYTQQTIIGTGAGSYELNYADYLAASSSDPTYTVSSSSSDNLLTVTPALPVGTSLTVTYALHKSFLLATGPQGTVFQMDSEQPSGVLITYEGGSGAAVTDLPLHPYYNPRTSGFVYLSADFYLPAALSVRVDPYAVPADGVTSYTVKVQISDAYGAGTAGLPVSVLVNYREGALSFNGTTDVFGFVTLNVPASSAAQTTAIIATLQLVDATGTPLTTLLDQTYVEMFSSYA